MLRAGFAFEWALVMDALKRLGHVDVVASHLANLVTTGRPQLAAEGARALAQTLPSERVSNALCTSSSPFSGIDQHIKGIGPSQVLFQGLDQSHVTTLCLIAKGSLTTAPRVQYKRPLGAKYALSCCVPSSGT